jgi:AcrR family transcriptional regulator
VPPRLTRSERAALTRRGLLEVAERRFFTDGYHGTSLDDIAEEAGYTKGAVYSAYQSKAGLFLALLDEVIERRLAETRRLLDENPTGEAKLAALARQPVDERNVRFSQLSIEFLVHARRDPTLLADYAERHRRLRSSMAALAPCDGVLGPTGWALVTLALSNGLALERLIDPDGVPDNLMATVQSLIAPPQGAGPTDA